MHRILFRSLAISLFIASLFASIGMPVFAQEMSCPEHVPVTVDIKPGSDPNGINLSSKGLIPVAVIATGDFDASLFAPEMAHLMDAGSAMGTCQGATAVRWAYDDVNKDGQLDIVFFFRVQELDLTPSSTSATFMAHGAYGSETIHILGSDSVNVITR
jgi:hypothetical protein